MTNHDDFNVVNDDESEMWTDDNVKFGCALALALAGFTIALVALVVALVAVFR